MRVNAFSGALAAWLAASAFSAAHATGQREDAPGKVPTVTIINKAPERTAEAEAGALEEIAPLTERAAPAAQAPDLSASGAVGSEADEALAEEAAAPAPPPEPTLDIRIDLTRQVMTVSEEGVTRYTWPISSARYGYTTPTGTFRPTWMAKMWHSRQYDYAPMPHSIFFHKGVAIHASYAIRQLGRPASHGCVRLAPKNAATLFKMVTRHGKARTEIVVHGTPNHGARVASRERGERVTSRTTRRANAAPYGYLPPSAYAPRGYTAYGVPPPGYGQPRRYRRAQQQAPRYYQPRGLYTGSAYGYGF